MTVPHPHDFGTRSVHTGRALRRRSQTLLLAAVLLVGAVGCDLIGEDRPEQARLRLEGTAGIEVRLVTSTEFLSQRLPIYDETTGSIITDTLLLELFNADTVVVTLPFDAVYDIRDSEQFFANILRSDPVGDALYPRLWVDGEKRYDQRPNAAQDSLIIIFNYRSTERDPDEDEEEV